MRLLCSRPLAGRAACCPSSLQPSAGPGSTWCVRVHLRLTGCCRLLERQSCPVQADALRWTVHWPYQPTACPCAAQLVRHLTYTCIPTHCLQAFGSCLQRTRLRTFLWTQPLLLAPILWMGRSHCAAQLAATPAAADQLQRIAAAMQRCSAWLPVGLLAGGTRGGGAALQAPLDVASSCLSVHFWLVLMLALCLPAILIHRLEGQERQALWEVRKRQRTMSDSQHGGSGGTAAGAQEPQRDLLLQQPQSVLGSIGELALAGYAAWLAGQLALQVLQGSSGS